MMNTATGQRVRSVHIERADGMQSNLDRYTFVYDRNGDRIDLADIPDALVDPAGWIDFDTEAERRALDDDEREPWQVDMASETWPARARIYARAVVEVMVVYDNEEV